MAPCDFEIYSDTLHYCYAVQRQRSCDSCFLFHASNDLVIKYGTELNSHLLPLDFILGPASTFELLRLRKSGEYQHVSIQNKVVYTHRPRSSLSPPSSSGIGFRSDPEGMASRPPYRTSASWNLRSAISLTPDSAAGAVRSCQVSWMGLHTGVALRTKSLLRLVGVEVLFGAGGHAAGFSVVHHFAVLWFSRLYSVFSWYSCDCSGLMFLKRTVRLIRACIAV